MLAFSPPASIYPAHPRLDALILSCLCVDYTRAPSAAALLEKLQTLPPPPALGDESSCSLARAADTSADGDLEQANEAEAEATRGPEQLASVCRRLSGTQRIPVAGTQTSSIRPPHVHTAVLSRSLSLSLSQC